MRRYGVRDDQWERIQDLLPGRVGHVGVTAKDNRLFVGGFEICIDGLSFWLMRIAREIGRGTSVQALRERRACQERADAQQAALPVQSLRPELHRHTPPGASRWL